MGKNAIDFGHTWPTRHEFARRAANERVVPVVRRLLADGMSAVGVYNGLCRGKPGTFLLESAESDGCWNRWSFVGVRARACLLAEDNEAWWEGDVPAGLPTSGNISDVLARTLAILRSSPVEGLPPLTCGLVGALGWDFVASWEPQLASDKPREVDVPDVALLLASDVVALDHADGSVWIIANAINGNGLASGVDAAYADAVARLDELEHALARMPRLALGSLGETPQLKVTPRVSETEFCDVVERCKEHVAAGDVFQVVPSQRFDVESPADPFDVYRTLRGLNPSPYMYLIHASARGREFSLVGASPETLMRLRGRELQTFPIAGSRPRGDTPTRDRELAEELAADEKERSEHLMLVDLARNDVSKVCEPDSVAVSGFMDIVRYSHIMHLTSSVTGRVREGIDAVSCLQATFPAGTLSGAPKIKAIELINAYEPARRGFYGGVIGHLDFTGDADVAIAIRTAVIVGARAHVQAGAGIVADSRPRAEFEETIHKSQACVSAVRRAAALRSQ